MIVGFFVEIYRNRRLIVELAKRDYQRQYKGSYLGLLWMYLQPSLFFGVLYVIFSLGLRGGAKGDVPFVAYLMVGLVSWLYFADNLQSMASVIRTHGFLVKRVGFRLSILPVVKIVSSSMTHAFLVLIAITVAWVKGFPPSAYTLQVVYYFMAASVLLAGFGWITSSTSIFAQDVGRIVSLVTQFGFWLTPIFWYIGMVPEEYQWLVKLNPAAYIVMGYRDSILYGVAFWDKPWDTLYFWAFSLATVSVGVFTFRRLRPHIAEVL